MGTCVQAGTWSAAIDRNISLNTRNFERVVTVSVVYPSIRLDWAAKLRRQITHPPRAVVHVWRKGSYTMFIVMS